jgi:hypothetical protein
MGDSPGTGGDPAPGEVLTGGTGSGGSPTGSTGAGGASTGDSGAGGTSIGGTDTGSSSTDGGGASGTGTGGTSIGDTSTGGSSTGGSPPGTGGDGGEGYGPVLDQYIGKTMYSSKPTGAATWLIGWTGSVRDLVTSELDALNDNQFVVFSTYYSLSLDRTGPLSFPDWVVEIGEAIADRGGDAVIALEADAFLLKWDDSDTHNQLDQAIGDIKRDSPNTAIFLDIGHSAWGDAGEKVSRVQRYGNYDLIDGWASNTANFQTNEDEIDHARTLYNLTGKPVIIDTSRNGCGYPGQTHNPPKCCGGTDCACSCGNDCWCEGTEFGFLPDEPAVFFFYYNKPSDEGD